VHLAQTNLQLYAQIAHWSIGQRREVAVAYQLAVELFAPWYRASGKPFVAHLVGTASALLLDGAGSSLLGAGLLHAAYQQGQLGRGSRPPDERARARVRTVVGHDVEDLVHRYQVTKWYPTLIEQAEAGLEHDRDVLALRVANELDEWADLGMAYCSKTAGENAPAVVRRAAVLAERAGRPVLGKALDDLVVATLAADVPTELRASATVSTRRGPVPTDPIPRRIARRGLREAQGVARRLATVGRTRPGA
jgi:(p)ppGpp synthase/HD superfamily hydrolase